MTTAPPELPAAAGEDWPMVAQKTVVPELLPGQAWPKISIITPSFEQGEFLEKTIRSVLLQGYPNLEYIIVDGGSSDCSVEIIKKYEPWLASWVSEKDRGQSHAINKGFERATGELLGWLNSDDWYTEGALFKLALGYLEDKSVGAVYGHGQIVDEQGHLCHQPRLEQVTYEGLFDWFSGHDFMQPSCLFTREAYDQCGPVDETLLISMDVDLWIKIAQKYSFKRIEQLLSLSLRHAGAKTTAMKDLMYVDFALMVMRHGNEAKAREVLNILTGKVSALQDELEGYRKMPIVCVARKISTIVSRLVRNK